MTSYSLEQDTDSPLARWRFEETTGTTFAEDVGSVTATLTGSVTPGGGTSTLPGSGVGADFSGGGASLTGASSWAPRTIEAIVRFDTLPSTGAVYRSWIFGHDATTSTNPLPMVLGFNLDGVSGTRGLLGVGFWTGTAWKVTHASLSTYLTAGALHHIVGVYNASNELRLYIDGVQRSPTASGAPSRVTTGMSSTAWIGRRWDGTAQIDGKIYDLTLYNAGLTPTRITAHYDALQVPGGLAISDGGDMFFDGIEYFPGGPWTLSGGGDLSFRATPLDPRAPATVDFTAHPSDPHGDQSPWFLQEAFGSGTTFDPLDHSTWVYTPGGAIERVIGSIRATRTDTDLLAVVTAADPSITNPGEWGPALKQDWKPAQVDFDVFAGVGAWPLSIRWSQNLYLAWQRINTTVTTGTDATIYWANLVVLHRRYNYASQPVAATPTLDVRGLVHDLLGRGVNDIVEYDPNRVAPGTPWSAYVQQAAWWNGVSAREVLALATTYAPGMWWAVLEPGRTGLPRFEVGRWNGPVRYVFAPGTADVQLSGGAGDIANRCLVSYIGTTFGNSRTTWVAEVRANVRGLAEAGIVRTTQLDLTSEGLMTPQAARARGISALRQAALARTAGKVRISQPIFDRVEGRMVEPWEVRAGSPVVVCDAPLSFSRSTSLAESIGADGVSVFRARGMAYDISSNTAELTLDGGARSLIGRFRTEAAVRRYDVPSPRN